MLLLIVWVAECVQPVGQVVRICLTSSRRQVVKQIGRSCPGMQAILGLCMKVQGAGRGVVGDNVTKMRAVAWQVGLFVACKCSRLHFLLNLLLLIDAELCRAQAS